MAKEEERRRNEQRQMDHRADLERFTEETAEVMMAIKDKENELSIFTHKFDEVKRQIEDRVRHFFC